VRASLVETLAAQGVPKNAGDVIVEARPYGNSRRRAASTETIIHVRTLPGDAVAVGTAMSTVVTDGTLRSSVQVCSFPVFGVDRRVITGVALVVGVGSEPCHLVRRGIKGPCAGRSLGPICMHGLS
jgi:hypothetical protein